MGHGAERILHSASAGAAVIVMSHLGRPEEGAFDPDASLAPVALHLGQLMDRSVALLPVP